jgi:hypothetical protein
MDPNPPFRIFTLVSLTLLASIFFGVLFVSLGFNAEGMWQAIIVFGVLSGAGFRRSPRGENPAIRNTASKTAGHLATPADLRQFLAPRPKGIPIAKGNHYLADCRLFQRGFR